MEFQEGELAELRRRYDEGIDSFMGPLDGPLAQVGGGGGVSTFSIHGCSRFPEIPLSHRALLVLFLSGTFLLT